MFESVETKEMDCRIIERSSGYWIVNENGVAYGEPFVDLGDAHDMLEHIKNGMHDWENDQDGYVYCKDCGIEHPDNVPEWDTESLQDSRADLFHSNGIRKADY